MTNTADQIITEIQEAQAKRASLEENPLLKEDPPLMPTPTNENLRRYLRLSFDLREETPELLSMFKTIVDGMGAKSEFKAYTWIDEMKEQAYKFVLKEWQLYEDSVNPFAGIVGLVKESFYKFLQDKKAGRITVPVEETEEDKEASEVLAAIRERKAEKHKAIDSLPPKSSMPLAHAEMPVHSHSHGCITNATYGGAHTHSMAYTAGYRTDEIVTWSADRLERLDKQVAALEAEKHILHERLLAVEKHFEEVVVKTECEPQESPVSDYDRAMGVIE